MGTGSHRPQFEAARGRPDELGGIQHARSLKSHTRLKYRSKQSEPQGIKEIESKEDAERGNKNEADNNDDDDDDEDDDDEDDDDLEAMQRELDVLKKRNALRAQKSRPKTPSASAKWRSESLFKKPKSKPKSGFVGKYVR